MKKNSLLSILAMMASMAMVSPVAAEAIWTTLADGTEVNFNIYDLKEDVYLNGGPGKNAGTNAKGLDDGTYVFMVTNPNGDVLLSTDAAGCRQVIVIGGFFAGVVPFDTCQHALGTLGASTPVQLIPYLDTPNNGGEYKVWLTPLGSYLCNGDLNVVDCGIGGPDTHHGFIHSESKTDNFKVKDDVIVEIDTRFFDDTGQILDGRRIRWLDTHSASNTKWSYYAPEIYVNHEAHVEAPEVGLHYIVIGDQPGCTVGEVYAGGVKRKKSGPQTVPVRITQAMKNKSPFTIFVDVFCTSTE